MSNVVRIRRPIHWDNLRADEAEWIIRERVADSGNVIFTDHTWDRVDEREITREDTFMILERGFCQGQPEKNEKGNWQVVVTRRLAGRREAGAVTIILENEESLIIRTVEWVDPK